MENQIKANQKRIQLIQSENQKLISALGKYIFSWFLSLFMISLGRLHNPNYESETSSLQERHRDNLDLHEPEDIEVLDLEEDQFSIPSTLTATARAPSRINSGKFQGMECTDCSGSKKSTVMTKIKFLVRGVAKKP